MELLKGFRKDFTEYYKAEKGFIQKSFNDKTRDNKSYYDLLCKYIKRINIEKINILEVGCGTGQTLCFLASRFHHELYGIDILDEAINASKKTAEVLNCGNKIKFFQSDAEDLPFPDEFFHVVFSQGTFEHFKDITKIMNEQIRVLNKRGYLIINVPQKFSYYTIKKHIKMMADKWGPGWETQYSYFDFKKIAKKYKLTLIDAVGEGYDSKITEIIKAYKYISNTLTNFRFCKKIDEKIRRSWKNIIKKYGHFFLVEIIGVFSKIEK